MNEIKKAAVIGAGTMGGGIASHLANAGIPVVLLDVAADGGPRNAVAEQAVARLLESSPPAFMHADNARLVTTGNIADDMSLLADADWIAEAVVERLDVKRALYRDIDAVRKPGSMVSSNTSTIPLALLVDGQSPGFRADFCITHFFNPVRFMRLLEIVAGEDTRPDVVRTLAAFCDEALGKGVVHCRDTPGFLGNRVGVFALQVGLIEAAAQGLAIEAADAIMGRPMGIPKTGVFGLYDLIGLDLMQDVVASLISVLPPTDAFHEVAPGIPAVARLVTQGYTGNKGLGGFYRTAEDGDGPRREVLDLETGAYRPATRPALEAARAGEQQGLRALVERADPPGRFAWRVLARTLAYAGSLVPEVSDEIVPIDEAMRLGYSWSLGPFEMIDSLGVPWFRERLVAEGIAVPEILAAVGDGPFYHPMDGRLMHFTPAAGYRAVRRPGDAVRLTDLKRLDTPRAGNAAASLWDVGEGVACLEFHTKANALSPESMRALDDALAVVERDFAALILHSDAPHFSVGFNLEFTLACARERAWARLEEGLADFQRTCKALKYAPFPVVGAPAGMALGGGFEVLLHCDALQAHANTVTGLVEPLVGLVPSGGGCKEMLLRWHDGAGADADAAAEAAVRVFRTIGMATTAASPAEAAPRRFFLERDRATMNRDHLLVEARSRAGLLAEGYTPPVPGRLVAAGAPGMAAMQELLDGLVARGVALRHDVVVSTHLARVLAGGDRAAGDVMSEDDLCALEREAFLALAGMPATVARIEHMLEVGRALRN